MKKPTLAQRPPALTRSGPSLPGAPTRSWWVCPDQEFSRRVAEERPRMVNSRISGQLTTFFLADVLRSGKV